MKIVERYIAFSILRLFISCLLVFCFLYVLIDAASNLDEYIRGKIPLEILLQ